MHAEKPRGHRIDRIHLADRDLAIGDELGLPFPRPAERSANERRDLFTSSASRPDAEAPAVYTQRCGDCHGDTGRGDGLAGRAIDPAPRNFADPAWQAARSDDRIRFVIRQGGAAAQLSASMAAHPDLSASELDALVTYIRSVGQSGRRL